MMSLFASWWIAALFWFQKCISSITCLCSDFSPCNLKSSKMHWVKRAPQHFSWTCRLREVQIFYTCYKCIAKFYLVWMKRPRACWRVTLIYSSNIRSLQAVYMILVKQAWWQQLQQIKDKYIVRTINFSCYNVIYFYFYLAWVAAVRFRRLSPNVRSFKKAEVAFFATWP